MANTESEPTSPKLEDETVHHLPKLRADDLPTPEGGSRWCGSPVRTGKGAKTWHDMAWKRESKPVVSWGWWWELGGLVLCLISMALLLAMLGRIDQLAFEKWDLPIQPNSLISVFTTVMKTSLMVPVVTCISQLKWRHYLRGSHPLNHLELYEEASRGPWGSLVMLWLLKCKPVLASLLAIVTVASLAFEPTAQQILEIHSRRAPLTNVTAEIGVAREYDSRSFNTSSTSC
jgi:hypothetical protein